MKKFNKKLSRSRSGVSEIIGNLMILAITVTLFSSIMFYVANMSEPAQATFTDLEADTPITISVDTYYETWINITHKGGQALNNYSTGIYIFINGELAFESEKSISDSENGIGADGKWSTGEVWSNKTYSSDIPTTISVMIVDKETNSIVWQSDIRGGANAVDLAPIIGNRYTVPYVGTVGKPLTFYVTVIDPNDNLDYSSVTMDAQYVNGEGAITMNYKGNNVFNVTLTPTLASEGGTTVVITAEDMAGNSARALMNVVVYPKSGSSSSGGSDGTLPNIEMSGLQGFNTFEMEDWLENNFSATPADTFLSGQDVELVVISRLLVNLDTENTVYVLNALNKTEVATLEMEYYDYYSGIFIYTLDITDLADGKYLLQIQLKDSYTPNNIFFAVAQIQIGDQSSLPTMHIYTDSAYTNEYVIDEDDPFEITDVIYFTVECNHNYPWLQYGGDVILTDFVGGQQIKRVPDLPTQTTDPPNPVEYVGQVGNLYYFMVDLKKANQDPWLGSTNTYLLTYDIFKTYNDTTMASESSVLVEKVRITAPKFKLDIVAAIDLSKNTATLTKDTMVYYENDNLWSPGDVIQGYSDRNKDAVGMFVETADMNGDLKGDIVAIVHGEGIYQLNLYLNDGSWTIIQIATLTAEPTSMALGNIDFDNDKDIVVGFSTGRVTVYRNDGVWTPLTLTGDGEAPVTKVLIADLDIDNPTNVAGRSLDVVVGRSAGGIDVYKNVDGAFQNFRAFNYDGQTIIDGTESNISVSAQQLIQGSITSGSLNDLASDNDVYEVITEVQGDQNGACYPYQWWQAMTSTTHYTETPIANIQSTDGVYVDLTSSNPDIGVNIWARDSNIVNLDGTVTSITLEIWYKTTAANQYNTQYVTVHSPYSGDTMLVALSASTTMTKVSVTIDPEQYQLDTFNNLSNLQVYIDGNLTNSNRHLYIDSWNLVVEMTDGPATLSTVLNATVANNPGGVTSYVLNINAHSSSADQYYTVSVKRSTDAAYTRAFVIGGTSDINYAFRLSFTDYTGEINIKIDSIVSSDWVTADSVYLDKINVYTFSTLTSGVGSVSGLAVGNLDLASNNNEIVIMDTIGNVHLARYSYVANSFDGGIVYLDDFSTSITNVKDMAIGYVIGSKNGRVDIMVVTTTTAYALDHNATTLYSFDKVTLNANIAGIGTLYSVCIGDVNGDGYLDFVGGTQSGYLYLFRNLLGNMWQTILIDHRYEIASSSGSNMVGYAFVDIAMGKLEEG